MVTGRLGWLQLGRIWGVHPAGGVVGEDRRSPCISLHLNLSQHVLAVQGPAAGLVRRDALLRLIQSADVATTP